LKDSRNLIDVLGSQQCRRLTNSPTKLTTGEDDRHAEWPPEKPRRIGLLHEQDRMDWDLAIAMVIEQGRDRFRLVEDLVDHVRVAPANEDLVAAHAKLPGHPLGLDDEHASRPNDNVIDIRPRPGQAAVMQRDVSLGQPIQLGPRDPLAFCANAPGADMIGLYPGFSEGDEQDDASEEWTEGVADA
jgi:hypothetical protein